jgi:hypothetical protein
VKDEKQIGSENEIKKKPIDYNKLKRQEKQTCRGKKENGEPCTYAVEDGKNCCKRAHADMEDYTEEMFENQQLCKSVKWHKRPRWRYFGEGVATKLQPSQNPGTVAVGLFMSCLSTLLLYLFPVIYFYIMNYSWLLIIKSFICIIIFSLSEFGIFYIYVRNRKDSSISFLH